MHDFIIAEDSELWDVICDGRFVPMKTIGEGTVIVPKTRKEYNDADRRLLRDLGKRFLFVASDQMSTTASQLVSLLMRFGKLFKLPIRELLRNKLVRKILSVLPGFWESKVNDITKAKDLQKLTIDELIGNLKTYEMKRKKDLERREPKKEKNLVLKAANKDSSSDESDIEHFVKDCPLQDHHKTNTDKAAKRNPVPDRKFKRRDATDNMVKQALADWGDSSNESEGEDDQGDVSMMVVDNEYESIFALMAKSDDDEDKEEDAKKLMSLENVLIDAYHSLINEKNALIEEIGDIEQERDDMVVSIVDLREQVEEVTREQNLLKKQTKKWMDNTKGKEVASEAQLELESELKKVKTSLVGELEKNRQLQEDLKGVKNDLDKSLKWTWSSDVITSMYRSNGGNRQGIGFQKTKTSYNPHSNYVIMADNRLCNHCGQTGHYKDSCKDKIQSLQKNKVFVEKKRTDEESGSLKRKYVLPAWAKRS
ncbi:PREDICTED: uncharacterized protein LOC109218173 [Nicotiana attenuata]|uniref:uncharacterized protein LOC109218173 n=1 Tax=Nicotiana attenuata TaxID=49451 RepID=UPI000904FE67|nr:PREDICTED: uncharacterized protein LOC109218173 [Nicotiana attenuata]